MKKILIISSIIITLIAISTIGYNLVSASVKIDEYQDIILVQEQKEKYITPYGYTLDNPNIILNPYGNSPLSAIILFETDEELPVTITIIGKDNLSTYKNTFKSSKKHYLPIYGLYPNTINNIEIKCGNETKNITIETDALPEELLNVENTSTSSNSLTFISTNKYTYALDNNNEIRWYLDIPITKNIISLENGHFLLSTNNLNKIDTTNTLIEIDLLGKIYKQYLIDTSNTISYTETPDNLYILTNNLLEVDKQTLTITNTIILEDKYSEVFYNPNNNTLNLSNDEQTLELNLETKEETVTTLVNNHDQALNSPLYTSDKEYQIITSQKVDLTTTTKQSNKSIFLVGYKSPNKEYKNYNINITKTADTLQVSGDFAENDKVYLILDKFLDKKVYDITNNEIIVNKKGLSGKYSIYLKINDTIYKTDNYIKF